MDKEKLNKANELARKITEHKTGLELISLERNRQIKKGYSYDHDALHKNGDLAIVASYLALPRGLRHLCEVRQPFGVSSQDRIDDLVKAGALIAAEIDRLTGVMRDKIH